MTKDEIIEMAKEANIWIASSWEKHGTTIDELVRFAKVVAQHEREAEITNMSIQRVPKGEMSPEEFAERSKELIAKVVKLEREMCAKLCEDLSKDMTPIAEQAAKSCATLIRARTA